MSRSSGRKFWLITFLSAGFCFIGIVYFVLNNKDYVRDNIRNYLEQSSTGSFMLDMYHKATPSTEENSITYSIFDHSSAWKLEDEEIRAALPEIKIIKGLDINNLPANATVPLMQFNTWMRSGADNYSSKYSELDQINKTNVNRLTLAWVYHSKENTWRSNVETNPIVADGNLFVATPANFLVSINATNGSENWRTSIRTPARRGLLWWPGNATHAPRLFVPSTDGVYAVDPTNGKLVKDFGDAGRVGSDASLVAPAVDGARLIIATNAPAIESYDVETGKLLWKTPLLELAPALLEGPTKFRVSGGLPWTGFSVDSARSRIFVSTGNAEPNLYGVGRPGPNKFSSSLVSIDSASGEIKWSFQEVSHDLWDFDVPSAPILVKVRKQDKIIDAVAAVTKIGNTLLLDRDTGTPLFDFRLQRAPVSKVPGEQTSPYQPAVELPEPFTRQAFDLSDITDIGEGEKATVESKLKNAEFGFFVPPVIHGKVATFAVHGGAEWPGAAVDEATGILYVPSNQYPWILHLFYSERIP